LNFKSSVYTLLNLSKNLYCQQFNSRKVFHNQLSVTLEQQVAIPSCLVGNLRGCIPAMVSTHYNLHIEMFIVLRVDGTSLILWTEKLMTSRSFFIIFTSFQGHICFNISGISLSLFPSLVLFGLPFMASQYCFGKVFPIWSFPAFYFMHANCPNGDGNQSSFGRFRYYYVNYRTFLRR